MIFELRLVMFRVFLYTLIYIFSWFFVCQFSKNELEKSLFCSFFWRISTFFMFLCLAEIFRALFMTEISIARVFGVSWNFRVFLLVFVSERGQWTLKFRFAFCCFLESWVSIPSCCKNFMCCLSILCVAIFYVYHFVLNLEKTIKF